MELRLQILLSKVELSEQCYSHSIDILIVFI